MFTVEITIQTKTLLYVYVRFDCKRGFNVRKITLLFKGLPNEALCCDRIQEGVAPFIYFYEKTECA
jgi:hypothetical protein